MKNQITAIVAVTVLFVFHSIAAAQVTPPAGEKPAAPQPPPPSCATFAVRGPQGPVRDGTPVKFTLNISGGNPQSPPVYSWSISAGTITSGQGTTNIDVDTTGAGADRSITATVMLSGYPPECSSDANATAAIAGPAHKVDEYGTLKEEEETTRLDNLKAAMASDDYAYIIAYGGKTSVRGLANSDLRRIRAYLLKIGVDGGRLITMDGGYREQPSHEIWLMPMGAEPPHPSPTVNAKDVVFPKPQPPTSAKKPS
jgi:hypothetical protein